MYTGVENPSESWLNIQLVIEFQTSVIDPSASFTLITVLALYVARYLISIFDLHANNFSEWCALLIYTYKTLTRYA